MSSPTESTAAPPTRVLALRFAFLPYLLLPEQLLLESLAERGLQVTLVKTRPRNTAVPEESRPQFHNVLIQLLLRRLPKSAFLEPFIYLEFLLRSLYHGLRARPGIIIAVDLDTLLPALIIGRLRRKPVVYYSLELYTEREGFRPKWFWVWLERRLINRANLVAACEANRAQFMQEQYGAREYPMVILNVPRREPRRNPGKIQAYLSDQGIPGTFILYYHGNISRGRCADQFVEALAHLPADALLFLVGPVEPAFRAQLEQRARELGVDSRVVFRGVVPAEDLQDYTASAHVGLQVQKNDGLNHYYCAPIKLFQYFAAGLPVIAPDFPGMIDIVERDQLGLCVDPEDPAALAKALRYLYDHPEARTAMAERAYALSQSRYCYEVEGTPLVEAIIALARPD